MPDVSNAGYCVYASGGRLLTLSALHLGTSLIRFLVVALSDCESHATRYVYQSTRRGNRLNKTKLAWKRFVQNFIVQMVLNFARAYFILRRMSKNRLPCDATDLINFKERKEKGRRQLTLILRFWTSYALHHYTRSIVFDWTQTESAEMARFPKHKIFVVPSLAHECVMRVINPAT